MTNDDSHLLRRRACIFCYTRKMQQTNGLNLSRNAIGQVYRYQFIIARLITIALSQLTRICLYSSKQFKACIMWLADVLPLQQLKQQQLQQLQHGCTLQLADILVLCKEIVENAQRGLYIQIHDIWIHKQIIKTFSKLLFIFNIHII